MPNADPNPEYAPPPQGAAPRAAQASQTNFQTIALILAAFLLLAALALYLLWRSVLQPWLQARNGGPLAGEELAAVSRAAQESAPLPVPPDYGAGAPGGHLTPANGTGQEEDLAPPAPGLLMAPVSLNTVSYTGPALAPAALRKEVAEDRAGCKAGDMFKCLRLGGRYLAGHGVERDAGRAFPLINKACAGGIAEACTTQGILQMSGHGTAQDIPAGIALCDKACAAGDMYGCSMLGGLYLEGTYMPADPARAVKLLDTACSAKLGAACMLLGTLYAEGKGGLPPDPAKAEQLLDEACGLNEKNACQLHQQLVQKRTAAGR
ncbi:MAG TPA: hypothetical protein DCZ92_15040 [Elusimicrobia bacterium]|nr:hypothetical protein [Elusimicrobiota bacterium]